MLKELTHYPLIDLKAILKDGKDENTYLVYASNALVYRWLGKNYFDSEEVSASLKYFSLSL